MIQKKRGVGGEKGRKEEKNSTQNIRKQRKVGGGWRGERGRGGRERGRARGEGWTAFEMSLSNTAGRERLDKGQGKEWKEGHVSGPPLRVAVKTTRKQPKKLATK